MVTVKEEVSKYVGVSVPAKNLGIVEADASRR